jgi:hypothetical protein
MVWLFWLYHFDFIQKGRLKVLETPLHFSVISKGDTFCKALQLLLEPCLPSPRNPLQGKGLL